MLLNCNEWEGGTKCYLQMSVGIKYSTSQVLLKISVIAKIIPHLLSNKLLKIAQESMRKL